jgi:hypothetical protein
MGDMKHFFKKNKKNFLGNVILIFEKYVLVLGKNRSDPGGKFSENSEKCRIALRSCTKNP